MKARLLAALTLLVAAPSYSQLPYTEKQVIDYAKSVDVQTLDPSLPSQHLADWLQSGSPQASIVHWELAATCDLKPDSDSEDYPLCAKIWVSRNGQSGFFLVQVGTAHSGISGSPQLYQGPDIWEEAWVTTGGSDHLSDLPALLNQPVITSGVRKLYEQIIADHPIGIPSTAEMTLLRPYLSKRLTQQIQAAQACQSDFLKQHHPAKDSDKPGWMTTGIFSGDEDRARPIYASPVSKKQQKDGSFLVPIDFAYKYAKGGPARGPRWMSGNEMWRVDATVISEDNHFVVDNVRLFDGGSDSGPSHLLTDSFVGCNGPHWTGLLATNN